MPKIKQDQKIRIPKDTLQILHSATRALFQLLLTTDDYSAETLIRIQLIDAAIGEVHELLGTERSAADQYVFLTKGITEVQKENAKLFLALADKNVEENKGENVEPS